MTGAREAFARKGATELELLVDQGNQRAHDFFASLGFIVEGQVLAVDLEGGL
jgi:RimJ/RimL family protein N-acetyltransferase